ncbi:hypothetical protein BAUCODRAFT_353118 [Baudoinia panamericana UAMH 10762]|uniref:N-acetyltransferase domain-containing protein n=1 Tax=Baudoinia panamericana (strain UAMH 10762) TaxID=717646 RepID=M2N6Y1_BAUPA|nr:uncharacterized protein BAUCODRAFT_353118 [Baudoinia panamericana UAMH 10762]EMC99863.1 hypothetical protein BAUCODRAFT_353118 [Baudoinia panamericana UAMH 10762]
MASVDLHVNGAAMDADEPSSQNIFPGTTLPEKAPSAKNRLSNPQIPPQISAGPSIDGKKTTVTLYEPSSLVDDPIIPAMVPMINAAFRDQHLHSSKAGRIMPASIDRLPKHEDYLKQVGNDHGTFVFILTTTETGVPIATVAAHRYIAPVYVAVQNSGRRTAFDRMRRPEGMEDAELWEVKLLAVDVAWQKRGLASYLMNNVEAEVRRRFVASRAEAEKNDEAQSKRLCMVLTTVKEANHDFYLRKGYKLDYETRHEIGYLGSETGFRVVHMSKVMVV